jgi:hypothetical protein
VDEDDDVLHEYVEAYDGIFLFGGDSKLTAGISLEGLFFIQSEAGDLLFTSSDFEQRVLELPSPPSPGCAHLHDHSSGVSYRVPSYSGSSLPPVRGAETERVYPSRLRVEIRTETTRDFDYIVDPLSRIFAAAAASGCRVHWT